MSRRDSGFERQEKEFYPTPRWVVHAFNEVVPLKDRMVWECACGAGEPAEAIKECGGRVFATDIHDYGYAGMDCLYDFLSAGECPAPAHVDVIFTNPPYGKRASLVIPFIEKGMDLIRARGGLLGFLLPTDFDHASTRYDLFDDCELYCGQIKLTKRIKWFDEPVTCKKCEGSGQREGATCKTCKGAGSYEPTPSENHSIFIWQSTGIGPRERPRVWYAPRPT